MEFNSWEHPFQKGDQTEPVQSFEAFQVWLEMGAKRSLKAVAERVEKSHDTIKKYSYTWKWSERLQDKLSYENKQIHAKQLEAVMTSLDIDSNRDLYVQNILGNLMWDIYCISSNDYTKFIKSDPETRKLNSPSLDALERLVNIYSKMEKIHADTQKKFIDLNEDCLSVHDFECEADYMRVIANGRKQQLEIISGLSTVKKMMEEKAPDDPLNRTGEELRLTPSFQPVGMYEKGNAGQVAGEKLGSPDNMELEE